MFAVLPESFEFFLTHKYPRFHAGQVISVLSLGFTRNTQCYVYHVTREEGATVKEE